VSLSILRRGDNGLDQKRKNADFKNDSQPMSFSMGTHDLRFLRNFFCKSSFFGIINIINDDTISGVLLLFLALQWLHVVSWQ